MSNNLLRDAAKMLSDRIDIPVSKAKNMIREKAGIKLGEIGDSDKIADAYLDLLEANGFS
jgi:hypothetical protein